MTPSKHFANRELNKYGVTAVVTAKQGRQNLKAKFLEVLLMAGTFVDAHRLHFRIHVEHHLSQLLNARVRHLFTTFYDERDQTYKKQKMHSTALRNCIKCKVSNIPQDT